MKKLVLVLFAVLLVIPALSNAGSVSSRYDVTFGGFVKYDFGYSSQNSSADPYIASRASGKVDRLVDKYGNTFMTGAETRFNFLVKGPDLWGAKTSAFIEGDFRGVSTGNSYGGFQLKTAFMSLNWPSAELMIGHNSQQWGMPYYVAGIGTGDMATYLKGSKLPQIAFRYFFTKEFNAVISVQAATESSGNGTTTGPRQFNDDYARSGLPSLGGEIVYLTDRCGKIGPNNLKFGLGGFYGREKKITDDDPIDRYRDPVPFPINGEVSPVRPVGYHQDTINSWMAAFRYSVPIIPEKQGNKQYAMLLNGNFFIGQNWGGIKWTGLPVSSYWRGEGSAYAPTGFGFMSQLSFWFTDKLWTNLAYGYLKYNISEDTRVNESNRNSVNMNQAYLVNLMWDANQAIRFGLQWNRLFTGYNASTYYWEASPKFNPFDRVGTNDIYRIAAWYFF